MRIVAVDDERIALNGLVSAIKKVAPDEELLSFQSPSEALSAAKESVFDIAFLDVEMRGMDGITLAKRLKAINPKINIIFTTGYMEYAVNAIALRVSGYVTKPITPEKINCELNELRNPIEATPKQKMRVKAFGNFEVYVGKELLKFQNSKTKELFAYLIDRNGSTCTKQEIIDVLWDEDGNSFRHNSYMNKIRADLIKTLENAGCRDILFNKRGILGIFPDKIYCDYFEYLKGTASGINAYRGEYMTQYSWGERTHGSLEAFT